MNPDRRLYEIACSFPALKNKGVQDGHIPGITPDDFYDLDLSAWLYQGGGGLLSHGEFLILEALLNLCNPSLHDRFNLGEALQTLDPDNMHALCKAIVRTYNRRKKGIAVDFFAVKEKPFFLLTARFCGFFHPIGLGFPKSSLK